MYSVFHAKESHFLIDTKSVVEQELKKTPANAVLYFQIHFFLKKPLR